MSCITPEALSPSYVSATNFFWTGANSKWFIRNLGKCFHDNSVATLTAQIYDMICPFPFVGDAMHLLTIKCWEWIKWCMSLKDYDYKVCSEVRCSNIIVSHFLYLKYIYTGIDYYLLLPIHHQFTTDWAMAQIKSFPLTHTLVFSEIIW